MTMQTFIYVDHANLFIEGARVSAVSRGQAASIEEARSSRITDRSFRIDFGKLHRLLVPEFTTARARIFGSRNEANGAVWEEAARCGFEVVVQEVAGNGKDRKIDSSLVLAVARDAYRNAKQGDRFTIVSGDNEYCTLIAQLQQDGFAVEVLFWNQAGRAIKRVADKFVVLDPFVDALRA